MVHIKKTLKKKKKEWGEKRPFQLAGSIIEAEDADV